MQNYLDYLEFKRDPKSDAAYRLFDRLHSNATNATDLLESQFGSIVHTTEGVQSVDNTTSSSSDAGANSSTVPAALSNSSTVPANSSTVPANSSTVPAALSEPVNVTFTSEDIEGFRNNIEMNFPMTFFIIEEARRAKINYKLLVMPIMKRGVCTFVQKASIISEKGANFGVLVNQNDDLIDLPAGKETTNDCTKPFAITKDSDTALWLQAGLTNEILAVISDPIIGYTSDCIQLQGLVEDILEKWSHSLPRMELQAILKVRN